MEIFYHVRKALPSFWIILLLSFPVHLLNPYESDSFPPLAVPFPLTSRSVTSPGPDIIQHVCMDVSMHGEMLGYMYVCIDVCVYECMDVCMTVCIDVCMDVCVHECMDVCMAVCMHLSMCGCMYGCMHG